MHFQTTHTNIDLPCNTKIDNLPLLKKDNVKFLELPFLDKHLTWNQHVNNISISIAKGIGILYKVKDYLLEDSFLMIYNTLILPYISYCKIVWGNCHKTKLNHIFLLQKKAVRICTNSTYLSHTNPLLCRLKVFKLHDINTTSVARGGGGGGGGTCPPIMLFRSFVGTFGNLSVHVNRQACHLYRQSIWSTDKILKKIALLVCKNATIFVARSLA